MNDSNDYDCSAPWPIERFINISRVYNEQIITN